MISISPPKKCITAWQRSCSDLAFQYSAKYPEYYSGFGTLEILRAAFSEPELVDTVL
jgi:hypothetical protein